MNCNPIVLIGGGGHCKSVIEAAESSGTIIHGILDAELKKGNNILGYPVLGDDALISSLVSDYKFVVTVGQIKSAKLRIQLHKKVADIGGRMATVIASSAVVSKHSKICAGSVIMHHALVNAGARIGDGCIINSFANIEHDVKIDDYCHISTGAMINGDCQISSGTFIGSQSVLSNGVKIQRRCVIGAGSLVKKNIIKSGLYSGVPAIFKGLLK